MRFAKQVSESHQIFHTWPAGTGEIPKPDVYCFAHKCVAGESSSCFYILLVILSIQGCDGVIDRQIRTGDLVLSRRMAGVNVDVSTVFLDYLHN